MNLQEVQVASFAGQTARWSFENVPPHFIQLLLLSILRVGFLLTLKWLFDLCTDDPLDLKLFVNLRWFKVPFSSMSATFSASRGGTVSVNNFLWMS